MLRNKTYSKTSIKVIFKVFRISSVCRTKQKGYNKKIRTVKIKKTATTTKSRRKKCDFSHSEGVEEKEGSWVKSYVCLRKINVKARMGKTNLTCKIKRKTSNLTTEKYTPDNSSWEWKNKKRKRGATEIRKGNGSANDWKNCHERKTTSRIWENDEREGKRRGKKNSSWSQRQGSRYACLWKITW